MTAKRNMMHGSAIALSLILCHLCPATAQKPWSLRDCCDYAVAHNISVKQRQVAVEKQSLVLSTARNSRLPDLNGSIGENLSFGRGLTADNVYTNKNTSNTSFSLQTTVPLFTGFQIPENIRLSRLNLEAVTQDLEKAKNDIRMQVAQAYVQILYDKEMAAVAHRQVSIDSMQVVRLEAFFHNGKASEAEVARQRATMAASQTTATQADNRLRLGLLTLSQLLELPSPEGFDVVVPTLAERQYGILPHPDAIYAEALACKPEIQSQELRLRGADHSINIARAGHYPKLNFNAGLGTNYYKTSGVEASNFGEQLKNNFSQFIGISLNVPIFNRFSVRNNIRSAKADKDNQQLALDNAKKTLYKEIQQVYYNALNADAKEQSSQQAQVSSHTAFELTKAKYENGKATLTEFNEAKNTWLKAESDLVQARYENLYQHALIDFYRGRELTF